MRKEDLYKFLIRSTIPEVAWPGDIPDDEDITKYFPAIEVPDSKWNRLKSNLVWDAVWKAHWDVFRAGDWKTHALFRSLDRNGNEIETLNSVKYEEWPQDRIDGVTKELFARIMKSDQPLNSEELIFGLYETFPEPKYPYHNVQEGEATRFGIIQLLVNLTLKYLLILKIFGCVGIEGVEIDEAGCDCPLDQTTCEAMGGERDDWKRITPEGYRETQRALRKSLFLDSGVAYDFLVRFPEITLCKEAACGESKGPQADEGAE